MQNFFQYYSYILLMQSFQVPRCFFILQQWLLRYNDLTLLHRCTTFDILFSSFLLAFFSAHIFVQDITICSKIVQYYSTISFSVLLHYEFWNPTFQFTALRTSRKFFRLLQAHKKESKGVFPLGPCLHGYMKKPDLSTLGRMQNQLRSC